MPPWIIEAAAYMPSMPTTNVPIVLIGSRGFGDGIACTKIGMPSRSASWKNGRNRSSPMEAPAMFEEISTPYRPASRIAFSSAVAASTSCIGTMPKPIHPARAAPRTAPR